jgi:hypothetical protein
MCIFETTLETPQTEFEILIQNYREKPYTTFLEKMEFFTRKPTKLDLYFSDFSTIFNGVYKFLRYGSR